MYRSFASFNVTLDESSTFDVDLPIIELPPGEQYKITMNPTLHSASGTGGAFQLRGTVKLPAVSPLSAPIADAWEPSDFIAVIDLPELPVTSLPLVSPPVESTNQTVALSIARTLTFRPELFGTPTTAYSATFNITVERYVAE